MSATLSYGIRCDGCRTAIGGWPTKAAAYAAAKTLGWRNQQASPSYMTDWCPGCVVPVDVTDIDRVSPLRRAAVVVLVVVAVLLPLWAVLR